MVITELSLYIATLMVGITDLGIADGSIPTLFQILVHFPLLKWVIAAEDETLVILLMSDWWLRYSIWII